MKDYPLTILNLEQFMTDIQKELEGVPMIKVNTSNPSTGKWGMARLWRKWMEQTASFMAAQGVAMPLMMTEDGKPWGSRPINENDVHEVFTRKWLGNDEKGNRLSWSKDGRDDMRAADKGERWFALKQHEDWCTEKGIVLFKPTGSEYDEVGKEQGI